MPIFAHLSHFLETPMTEQTYPYPNLLSQEEISSLDSEGVLSYADSIRKAVVAGTPIDHEKKIAFLRSATLALTFATGRRLQPKPATKAKKEKAVYTVDDL
jgi:hypothetical protein